MRVEPDTINEDTGLEPILVRLRSHVVSDAALVRLDALGYAQNRTEAEDRLRLAAELQACFSFDDHVPFQAPDDVIGALDRSRPEGAALQAEEFVSIRALAQTSRLTSQYFASRKDKYPSVHAELSVITVAPELESAIASVFDEDGTVRDSASSELRQIRRELSHARSKLRSAIMRVLSRVSSDGFAADDQPTVRGGRMVIPVRAEAKRKISGFVHDVSSSGQTVYIEPAECLDQNNLIREHEAAEVREIERIRKRLTDHVRQYAADLRVAFGILTDFEIKCAVARLANEMGSVVPPFNDSGEVKIVAGRNPELVLHFREKYPDRDVIPLNLELGVASNTLVISGPNAGGKSVALKSIAVFSLMLARGIPIPVDERSSFPFFENILVDIGDSQSVEDDLSTYASHLARLNEMLTLADSNTLILIDEAGAGTDPEEGSALMRAVLEQLSERGARTVVTTHHGELKIFAHEYPHASNGSMIFDQESLKPTFKFKAGQPGSSYAPEMARRAGLPEAVLSRVRELLGADRADVSSFLTMLQGKIEQSEQEVTSARQIRKDAEKVRDQLTDRLDRIQTDRDVIRERALKQADEILLDANRVIERAVREIRESSAGKNEARVARESVAAMKADLQRDLDRVEKKRRKSKSVSTEPVSASRSTERQGKSDKDVGSRAREFNSRPISVGDRVKIGSADTVGEISAISGDRVTVIFGSAQMRTRLSQLTRVSGPSEQRVSVSQAAGTGSLPTIAHVQSRLDVRGMRAAEAVLEVMTLVDQAVVAGLLSVEVVHGKGTGALRQAIQEHVEGRRDVAKWEDAHPDQGGAGVTRIWLDL